jgi:hypothetical protein
MATDLGLLVGPGKSPVNVYCDCSDIEGKLLLTSSVTLCGDWDMTVLTTITGTACPHPPRYVAQPDAYEIAGLDVEPDEPQSTRSAEPRSSAPDEQLGDSGDRSMESHEPPNEVQFDSPRSTEKLEGASLVGAELTNDKLANVGDADASDEVGISQLMALADVGTPDEHATCDELVQHVRLLAEVLGALELTFNIKMAKLLSQAKRVYGGEEKFEDYAARQLKCSPRTVSRFTQVGREISETDYSRIPPPFRKLRYLTTIASGLKKGETLMDLVDELEAEAEGESNSESATSQGSTPETASKSDNNPTDPTENRDSEAAPSEPTNEPRRPTASCSIRGGEVYLGEPLRLKARKGSVEVTITRILVPRSIVEETLKSIDGDSIVLGGFTAFVDIVLLTR